jgi:hypothetical protein
MARKKLVGAPWEGPLPSPRVSPPRTLGDCIASAYHRSTTTNGGSSRSPARHSLPNRSTIAKNVQSRDQQKNSKIFERPDF